MPTHNGSLHTGMQRDQFRTIARALFGDIKQRFLRPKDQSRVLLSSLPLGGCQISQIWAPPHAVLAAQAVKTSYDADAIKVLLQMKGKSRLRYNDERVNIRASAAVIYDPTRSYSLMNETSVHQIILQAPRHHFDDRMLKRLARPLLLPADGENFTNTLGSFIRTAAGNAEAMSPDMRSALGQSLSIFAQGIISEAFRSDMIKDIQNGSLLLLRERVIEYVSNNITNSDLNVDLIANKMGCTPRYIFKAFKNNGETPQKFILNRRLELAKTLLTSTVAENRSVSEIAFRSGFNSSAHFCRVFKARFGLPPNEMRNAAEVH